jgi:uncharacterized membrane protein YdjX (TVP38/TMEM64 family)
VEPDTIQRVTAQAGSLGMVAFVLGVVVMELFWMPRMWGLLAAGVLFGPLLGCPLSFLADMLGALLCYGLAKGAGRQWIAALISKRSRTQMIVELLAERRGVATVCLLRVCPVAHYTLISYAAGLTGVRLLPFILGTGLGIIPGAVLIPLLGDAALAPGSPAFLILAALVAGALLLTLLIARRMYGAQWRQGRWS